MKTQLNDKQEAREKYPFKITIETASWTYECLFETTRGVSIYDITEQIAKKLGTEVPEGKFL